MEIKKCLNGYPKWRMNEVIMVILNIPCLPLENILPNKLNEYDYLFLASGNSFH